MHIETVETKSLGNRGYLIHDGAVGVAIDVQRDYQRWVSAADKAGITITHVFETHMHNDYVTGGYQLAKKHGAVYVVPEGSGVSFLAHELADNEAVKVGALHITGLHTPGHTEHHMSYLITGRDLTSAVFTGGGILYGTVGRTDLVSKEKTDELTYAQYDSAQRLSTNLADETAVFPTHGFGSFCSSADGSGAVESTMASEKKLNIVFTTGREDFARQIIAGLGPYPRYYAHMGSANQAGPAEVRQLHIHSYSAEDIGERLQRQNSWVVDIRTRKAFAVGHPEAALGIELGNSFATYAGWLLPWADDIMLVGETVADVTTAYNELSRIGMDSFVSGATHTLESYHASAPDRSYDRKTFDDLKKLLERHDAPFVLDVRLPNDWDDLHVRNSLNVPLHELINEMERLPKYERIWVHCASGYRASIAASLIDRSGRIPVLIDDKFERAQEIGLTSP